jgi:glutamine amidotransferase
MCRLFGFKSSISSQVHRSLLRADNALAVQSEDHPDGWGVAYYIENIPHLIKNSKIALEDNLFERVSGIVSSKVVLAHIRKASVGDINMLNCHPFQYGPWTFAHNGEIKKLGMCFRPTH